MTSKNAHTGTGLLSRLDEAVDHWLAKDGYQDTTSVKRAVDLEKYVLQKDLNDDIQQYVNDHITELQADVEARAKEYQAG